MRGGSFRRVLRTEALRPRRLPRTASPVTDRRGPRRISLPRPPAPRPGRWRRVECADRRMKDHSHGAGTPRIVRVGPSSVKGTRRSFLTASQKRSSGPVLERWSLCQPSGPDGEGQARGQARSARGESPCVGHLLPIDAAANDFRLAGGPGSLPVARRCDCRVGDSADIVLRAYAGNLECACALTSAGITSRGSAGGAATRPAWLAMALPSSKGR